MILLDTDPLDVFKRGEGNAEAALRRRIVEHHRATRAIFASMAIRLKEQMRGRLEGIDREGDAAKQGERIGDGAD